ncbi:MAG: hypothetical protein SWO11_22390, partial [Thermodesulfobacteriota bacterium]|nr:hypothetical protein [Thermodesulfobacteriota bacterium]
LPDIEKSKFRNKINRNKINLYGHPERGVEVILPEKKTVKREIEVFKAGEGNRPRKKISSDQKKALDEKYRTMAEVAGSAFDKRIRVDTDKLFGDEDPFKKGGQPVVRHFLDENGHRGTSINGKLIRHPDYTHPDFTMTGSKQISSNEMMLWFMTGKVPAKRDLRNNKKNKGYRSKDGRVRY